MFDDSEDDNDDEEYVRTEFEEWFDNYFMYFPVDLRVSGYEDVEIECFYTNVYCPAMKTFTPAIRQLMLKQFTAFQNEKRPVVLEELERIASNVGCLLLIRLYGLVYEEKMGVNFREKYPTFDSWVEFYARPGKPNTLAESFFDKLDWVTDEEKKNMIEANRKEAQEIFDWKENRKKAFYDLVQPIIFKYYKDILNLEPDSWILYAVHIREEYEDYLMRCDHMHTFIHYEFPEEDLHIPYTEFFEKFQKIWAEKLHLRGSRYDD